MTHLAPRLDESLQDLRTGDLEVDDDGREGGLSQLRRMIHRVAVQHDQLHRSAQLENPLDFRLDLGQVARPRAGLLQDGALRRVVQHGLLAEGDVGGDPRDDDPSFELVLEKLKDGLLHHVRDLVALEGGADKDERSYAGDDVVRRQGFLFFAQEALFLFDDGGRGDADAAAATAVEAVVVAVQAGGGRSAPPHLGA
jgi:hypothetical protein